MPYKKITQLPKEVKVLPILAQRMWLRVFNRAIRTNTEEQAFKIAWGVVKQFYVKKNDKWIKRK